MENKTSRFIAVDYVLYSVNEANETVLEEQTSKDKPFIFLTGFGSAMEAFEEKVEKLHKGEEFELSLTKDEAFGDHYPERVLRLDKEIFCIDGKFESEKVFEGAIVPLHNEDGNLFMGKVLEVGDSKVKIDLNHPLAGKNIMYKGKILENREATAEEIDFMNSHLNGGCGGNCHKCSGGCHGGDAEHECSCGDNHECGCGNCH